MCRSTWIGSLLTAAALTLHGAAPARSQISALSGAWTLDTLASDTLVLEPADTMQQRRAGLRVGVGGGWYGGFPPRTRSIRDPALMREAAAAVRTPGDRVFIAGDDSTVTISFDATPPLTLRTDGRKVRRTWLDFDKVEVRARWVQGALRIERTLESGIEIMDTYARDGDRLTVTTVVEGPILRRLDLRRTYEPAP